MRVRDYLTIMDLHTKLRSLASTIKKRLREEWDITIAITGEEGSGKSTLGVILGALIDEKFDLENNVSYIPTEKEIYKEFCKLEKFSCYLIDEAIRSLYKMNFMSSLQQTLIKLWATERWRNIATIMVLPRFSDLTENFRNHRVKIWIHVMKRGYAVIHMKDDDAHTKDPWYIDDSFKYKQRKFRYKSSTLLSIEQKLRIEQKLKTFVGHIRFPDLPDKVKPEYERMKYESRLKAERAERVEEEDPMTKQARILRRERNILIYLLNTTKGWNFIRIAQEMKLSKTTVAKIIRDEELRRENLERELEPEIIKIKQNLNKDRLMIH